MALENLLQHMRSHDRTSALPCLLSLGQLADVFVPDFGVRADKSLEQVDALLTVEIDNMHSVLAEPCKATLECATLADNQGADAELSHEAAAVPAGGERGDHDQVAVGGLPAGAAEGVGFSVDGGVALLHAAVVAAADQLAILREERRADGDSAFGEAETRFVDGGLQHLLVALSAVFFDLRFHANRQHSCSKNTAAHSFRKK